MSHQPTQWPRQSRRNKLAFSRSCVSGSVPSVVRRENKWVNRVKVIGRTAPSSSHNGRVREPKKIPIIYLYAVVARVRRTARDNSNATLTKLSIRTFRPRMTSPKSRNRSTGHTCTTVKSERPAAIDVIRRHLWTSLCTTKSPRRLSRPDEILRSNHLPYFPSFDRGVFFLFRRKTVNLHRTKRTRFCKMTKQETSRLVSLFGTLFSVRSWNSRPVSTRR